MGNVKLDKLIRRKLVVLLLAIALLPSITAVVDIQYSIDNASWINITNIKEINKTGYQANLQSDTLYYFRGKNETTDWNYLVQRTKDIIQADDYYLYITIFISFITLLGMYYYLEDSVFGVISGMLVIMTAIAIFNIGFPNLTNTLLKNGLVVILWGVGCYYVIIPSLNIITNWGAET